MPVPSQAWTYGAAGADTATWNTAGTLTDSVTSGGAVFAQFSGQAYAFLNQPLAGWQYGNPS